jgi:hypothetical protein
MRTVLQASAGIADAKKQKAVSELYKSFVNVGKRPRLGERSGVHDAIVRAVAGQCLTCLFLNMLKATSENPCNTLRRSFSRRALLAEPARYQWVSTGPAA